MSAAPEPVEPAAPNGTPEITAAAQLARERLHEEIERVRSGVEEMLDEQENGNGTGHSVADREELRRELDKLRIESRSYVKRKIRKSEKKLERSVREIDARTGELERRIDQVEADREEAEWRIHTNTEEILDGVLEEVRSIADLLSAQPAAAIPAPPPQAKSAQPHARPQGPVAATPPQAPVGRVGPLPLGRRGIKKK